MNRDKIINDVLTVFMVLGICCVLDTIFFAIVFLAPLGW